MYPNLPNDAKNLLFELCDAYRQSIAAGTPPAQAKRIHVENPDQNLMLLNILKSSGAVERIDGAHYVTLSPLAFLMEQHFHDRAQEHTEHKRQQRFQNKVSVLNVLIPLITFFAGILLEYYANIVGFTLSLFQ